MSDPVNPKHYRGDIVWQATKGLHPDGFNASKYIIRSTGINPEENKHPTAAGRLEDLKKAQWYLNKAIERTRAEAEQEAKAHFKVQTRSMPESQQIVDEILADTRTSSFRVAPTPRPDDWN